MNKENPAAELTEMFRDLREQAKFLHELGVEVLEFSPNAHGATAATATEVRVEHAQTSFVTREHGQHLVRTATPAKPVSPAGVVEDTLFADLAPAAAVFPQPTETLDNIWQAIGDCTRCGLCEGRTQVVNTHGNRNARLMFVGEAPGADEDAQGKPFVGRAGQLLTKMIEAMGMKREEVIIGNVNRCRPPGNRQPTLEEAAICRPFLFREISVIQPEIIVVMGNTALRNLLEIREGITRIRGKFQDFRGIKVMPTFHPAYLLRDPSKKKETWEDLKMVRDYLQANPPKTKS